MDTPNSSRHNSQDESELETLNGSDSDIKKLRQCCGKNSSTKTMEFNEMDSTKYCSAFNGNEDSKNADDSFPYDSAYWTLDNLEDIIEKSSSTELSKSLIITNLDIRAFDESSEIRNEFENLFRQLDPQVKFLYFKSFRRARVDFSENQAATRARLLCNQMKIGDELINCYFSELVDTSSANNDLLKPPALEKQFLISPPASPPEGWEPVEEAQPVLNIDLQSALANLLPGSTHELHPPTQDQPAIVVHICSESHNSHLKSENDSSEDDNWMMKNQKPKIAHTPCPPSMRRCDVLCDSVEN